jgi:DNA (cytosine-5)-methyltransferase 1
MTLGPYERPRWAHVQWFQHGTATDLGELASPNELFLTFECNDIGLSTIQEVVQVNKVEWKEKSVIPEGNVDKKVFFYRYGMY